MRAIGRQVRAGRFLRKGLALKFQRVYWSFQIIKPVLGAEHSLDLAHILGFGVLQFYLRKIRQVQAERFIWMNRYLNILVQASALSLIALIWAEQFLPSIIQALFSS